MLGRICKRLQHEFRLRVLRDPYLIEAQRWFRDDGDKSLRLDYPLTKDSIVFDLGGYKGDFADAINRKFGCRVFVFEPMPAFVEHLRERFADNHNITICPYALAGRDGTMALYDLADGSSMFRRKGRPLRCEQRAVPTVLTALGVSHIDLMKVNIEGGEYEVLPDLRDYIWRIKYLQIQFHNFIPEAVTKRNTIRAQLARTHIEQWCYPFVWESWRRFE